MEDFGDNFGEVDPAADFLAREQNELAGLEDDLNPVTLNPTTDDVVKEDSVTGTQQQEAAPTAETNVTPSVKQIREEPEKIKKWREEQKKRLEEKDENEEKIKEEWRQAAKKELEEWYSHHDDLIKKTKATNRNAEKQFVAEIDEIQPGTEWERISKLCDFNPKLSKSNKDVSRMRSIILQLKQNPKK
ncbi:hypothetical protein RUM44_000994 [Polyplax serrata]|uniref:Clathrin light chain n=1 Tax=Polyplax serrata TaxID=468196 RepID=A0ABR1B6I5_POLSC